MGKGGRGREELLFSSRPATDPQSKPTTDPNDTGCLTAGSRTRRRKLGRGGARRAASSSPRAVAVRRGQTTLDELVKTKIILVFFMNAQTPLYLDGMRHPPE